MTGKKFSRRDFIRKSSNVSAAGIVLSTVPLIPACINPSSDTSKEEKSLSGPDPGYGILDPSTFASPGTEYRGAPLWFFNEKIDIDESIRQLKEMRYAGWGLVLPRKFPGLLEIPYGEKWNQMIHEVLKTCEILDMKVFLQEGNVPFPEMKKEYGLKMLVRRRADEKLHENETLISRVGEYSYYEHLSYSSAGTTAFRSLDAMDTKAVSAYVESVIGYLLKKFGYAFEKSVDAIWVDEPRARNASGLPKDSMAWTTLLPSVFEKEWGYSLVENLPSLFEDVGNYKKVRHHYWRTICTLFNQNYWKLMEEICDKHKIKFSGHQYGEDTFGRQLEYTINCMPHYEYMQRPGIDHLTGTLTWPRWDRNGYPFILPPKQASSVANQLGKKEVLSEMYGTSDQGTSFLDRKWIFDWLAVLGINYRVYHGAFYSLRGNRKRVWPMTLNFQQPWWKGNRIIADYAARLSYVLRQGKYQADILIIHPIESYYMEAGLSKLDLTETGPLNMDFQNISHNLLKIHRPYDYGDESILAKYGKISKRNLRVGEMEYPVVIIPSIGSLRKSTVKLLKEFINAGGHVISVGKLPEMIDGELNDEIKSLTDNISQVENEPEALIKTVNKIVPASLMIRSLNQKSTDNIWIQERKLDSGQLFFLANTNKEGSDLIETEFSIKGSGVLESWDLKSGRILKLPQYRKGGFLVTRLQFSPAESHLLVLNENKKETEVPEVKNETTWQVDINSYHVKRQDPNALTLDFCRYKKGNQAWSEILPVIAIGEILNREKYTGPVTLQFDFTVETVPAKCAVVIENASEFSVLVNENKTSYEGLPYYRDPSFHPIDISKFIHRGNNRIEITRMFQPADPKYEYDERTYGTELEQIYLIGDFALRGTRIDEDWFESVRHRYSPKFLITKETGKSTGDLLLDGYHFFNGTIILTANVVLPDLTGKERIYIDLNNLQATFGTVKVNNQDAGSLAWFPYKLDITDFVWNGENKIEISLTNSLRNLLGELHYSPVLPGAWAYKFSGRLYDGPDWLEKRKNGTVKSWSDDYFFKPFGIGGKVVIICVQA